MLTQYFRRGGAKRMRQIGTTKNGKPIMKRTNNGGTPRGMFVATGNQLDAFDGGIIIQFGWSLCNMNAGDTFDEEFGKNIAVGRMNATKGQTLDTVPHSMRKKAKKFIARAKKYYKIAE